MDLVDCMSKSAFLGREWLVWLWFKSELFQGPFELEGQGQVEVWLQDQLTLEAAAQDLEQSQLKGPAPSTSPEAHEALRQGKLPTSARICLLRDELQYTFNFKADTLALGAVKLPTLVKEHTDEQFYERMYLLEQLEAMLDALYAEFLTVRLDGCWERELLGAIRGWINESPQLDRQRYEQLLAGARQAQQGPRAQPTSAESGAAVALV